MRIIHELKANIHYADTVTFEVAFTSDFDKWTDPVNDMLEDAGHCIVSQNADDTRFWITTVEDYYYTCANVDCSDETLDPKVWRTEELTRNEDDINNWIPGLLDDDPSNKFCTPMKPVSYSGTPDEDTYRDLEAEAYYECSKIKCVHQRRLDTSLDEYEPDDAHDFQFSETAGSPTSG